MNGQTEELAPCGICSDEVTVLTKAVACDYCQGWFHQSCGKISEYIYKKIEEAQNDNPYTWTCKDCKSKSKKKIINQVEPLKTIPA